MILERFGLQGKAALVTGSSRGLGAAIAVALAVFLASAASDYVHGHVLVVDGGWMNR